MRKCDIVHLYTHTQTHTQWRGFDYTISLGGNKSTQSKRTMRMLCQKLNSCDCRPLHSADCRIKYKARSPCGTHMNNATKKRKPYPYSSSSSAKVTAHLTIPYRLGTEAFNSTLFLLDHSPGYFPETSPRSTYKTCLWAVCLPPSLSSSTNLTKGCTHSGRPTVCAPQYAI